MGALVRFKAMACWLASAISLRKAGDEPETGAGEPATDTEKPRVVEIHALPPGEPSAKLSPWAAKRRFETLLSGLRFDSRDDLDLASVLIETVEAYLGTSGHEWATDYRLYLAGLRFVRHDPRRFVAFLHIHAWRVAAVGGLAGASATPWPPKVDESGRISPRDTALLWHRFAPGGEPWSVLDLSLVRAEYRGGTNPLVRAAWRISTRSRFDQLTERHRRALFGVSSEPLGFVRLAAEEANELAESKGDLHGLEILSCLLGDPLLARRHGFGRIDLAAQVHLDLARAYQRRGESGRVDAHLALWEEWHSHLPAECVGLLTRASIVELRAIPRDNLACLVEAMTKVEPLVASRELPEPLRAELRLALGERALDLRDYDTAVEHLEEAVVRCSGILPTPLQELPSFVLALVEARWSHFVHDLHAAGLYDFGLRSAGVIEAKVRHVPRLADSIFELENAAYAFFRDTRDRSILRRYRWSLARSLVLTDTAHAIELMVTSLLESADGFHLDEVAERAVDLLVPLLLLGVSRDEILDASPLRVATRLYPREVPGLLRSILDGTRHPLYGPIDLASSAPVAYKAIRELAAYDSATVH